jgi:hypothetical protein
VDDLRFFPPTFGIVWFNNPDDFMCPTNSAKKLDFVAHANIKQLGSSSITKNKVCCRTFVYAQHFNHVNDYPTVIESKQAVHVRMRR